MPRDIQFFFPHERPISPDYPHSRDTRLAWLQHHGLLRAPDLIERHQKADYALLAAGCFPHARGADLDLGIDQMNWFFVMDDFFDDAIGKDPTHAKAFITEALNVLAGKLFQPHPVLTSFADLWEREKEGMPPEWIHRAAAHWTNYFLIHVSEASQRSSGQHISPEEHITQRHHSIGCWPTYDMAERTQGFTIPNRLFYSYPFSKLGDTITEVVILHNELVSLEKEIASGESHNYALLLDQPLDEAIATTRARIDDTYRDWLIQCDQLPELYAMLSLTPDEVTAAERYVDDALRACYSGSMTWSYATGRYEVGFPGACP
ncbi:hypothetical protein ABZV75_32250 [Streptomyces flaveolus]|uniref:terpene synthase family protein n=1 Tax=Streptomyces flaveolus TaxID=67297 RepID=UPI00339EB4DA